MNLKDRKCLRNKYNISSDALVILCVARVDPMKNHDNFLKAYNDCEIYKKKFIRLVLIGTGTEKLQLPSGCIALGLKKNVHIFYSIADIIIIPSAFGEGFSNVLVEGMLTGLLPVATDVGDAKNIISNTGYIIKGSTVSVLKKKLIKLSSLKKPILKN